MSAPLTLAVLVTVYHRIVPSQLKSCLDSLAQQSHPADQLVIVEDGPVGAELAEIIDSHIECHPNGVKVTLETNEGAGPAAAAGMTAVATDLVARLDADDIAKPSRFEKQVRFFEQHPDIAVLGTAMAEFINDDISTILGVRTLPSSHDQIRRYARINSPVNNPSVMMRTKAVLAVGNYQDVHYLEDYDLYARLLAAGYRFHNLPEPLTWFRISDAVFQRRTDARILESEKQLQRNLVHYGLISRPRAVFNLWARTLFRALPSGLLKKTYSRLFHR